MQLKPRNSGNSIASCSRLAARSARRRRSPRRRKSAPTWPGSRRTCQSPETKAAIKEVAALADELQFDGTPVLGDRQGGDRRRRVLSRSSKPRSTTCANAARPLLTLRRARRRAFFAATMRLRQTALPRFEIFRERFSERYVSRPRAQRSQSQSARHARARDLRHGDARRYPRDAGRSAAPSAASTLVFRQSNHEGDLVDWIQEAGSAGAPVILNAGALTHTSIALHDAIKGAEAVGHRSASLQCACARELSAVIPIISPAARGVIAGFGPLSYILALDAVFENELRKT